MCLNGHATSNAAFVGPTSRRYGDEARIRLPPAQMLVGELGRSVGDEAGESDGEIRSAASQRHALGCAARHAALGNNSPFRF